LTASIIRELQRRNARYGMVTMCIGGGMGAPASSSASDRPVLGLGMLVLVILVASILIFRGLGFTERQLSLLGPRMCVMASRSCFSSPGARISRP